MRFFVFSTMKAGTMFLHKLLEDIATEGHLDHYSLNYPKANPYHLPSQATSNLTEYVSKDGCYGPFRHYFPLDNPENTRIILHFRDPRDVLTSMYFYQAYHQKNIPDEVRQTYINRGIDQFVFSPRLPESSSWMERTKHNIRRALKLDCPPTMTEWFLKDYEEYFQNYVPLEQTTIVTYEEMVTDFSGWLPKFLGALELGDQPQLAETLLAKHQDSFVPPKPQSEGKVMHKRKIVPGDHKNQMSSRTITQLNQVFSKQLATLGYEM